MCGQQFHQATATRQACKRGQLVVADLQIHQRSFHAKAPVFTIGQVQPVVCNVKSEQTGVGENVIGNLLDAITRQIETLQVAQLAEQLAKAR